MPEIPIRAFMVSTVAVRKRGARHEVLLLERVNTPVGAWCQVAGKIEQGETAWQAALRELREETGLVPDAFYSADTFERFYEPARDAITVAPVFVAFVDAGAEIRLNAEHSRYRWAGFGEAAEMVSFGGQRRMLRWVEEEFVGRRPSEYLLIPTG